MYFAHTISDAGIFSDSLCYDGLMYANRGFNSFIGKP